MIFFKYIFSIFIVLAFVSFSPVRAQSSVEYKYDAIGRLIEVKYLTGDVISYTYDKAGNRTQKMVFRALKDHSSIPDLGIGANLVELSAWPDYSSSLGPVDLPWISTSKTFEAEARWKKLQGPDGNIVALEAGQTEVDPNGGGGFSNWITINPAKAYQFSIYFRKYDLTKQNIYLGTTASGAPIVRLAYGTQDPYTNPYFMAWNKAKQASVLDDQKWYKVIGYILPEGYPSLQSTAEFGGVFDVETGEKISDVANFRFNEGRIDNKIYTRFFTYYDEATQNKFTTYFYKPEIKETNITYTPVVPSISMSHTNASEGDNLKYFINLSVPTTVDVSVEYYTGHDSASTSASANDYTAIADTKVVIPAGQTQAVVEVSTVEDLVSENNEYVYLRLKNAERAIIAESEEKAHIMNDDAGPSFSINNRSISEGGNLTFTVSKSGSTAMSHNVNYTTATGTAGTGDFTAKSGTLTFAAGDSSKTVTIVTKEDAVFENNEVMYVDLSSVTSGATISDSRGNGIITNDDAGPSFSINNRSISEGGNLTFTVSKSGSTALSHNVNYTTSTGTAGTGDFTAKSGTLTFAAGDSSKTVTVATKEDTGFENNEVMYVDLSSATSGATISDSRGNGTITNDDAAPSFVINNRTVNEGDNITFTITKAGGQTFKTHTVNYATSNGTASSATDYVSKSGTVSFSPSEISKTITISGREDSVCTEQNETMYVNLSAASAGALIGDSQGVGTIKDDDNCKPNAVDDSYSSNLGFFDRTLDVLANDTDGDGQSLSITNATIMVGSGYITIVNNQINFITSSCGLHTLQYTVSDGSGAANHSGIGSVTVNVSNCGPGDIFPEDLF